MYRSMYVWSINNNVCPTFCTAATILLSFVLNIWMTKTVVVWEHPDDNCSSTVAVCMSNAVKSKKHTTAAVKLVIVLLPTSRLIR